MTIASHLVATYLLGRFLGLKAKKDWLLAFLFGVGIDFLDVVHLYRGCRGFWLGETWFGRAGAHYYRSFIQEPVSLLWVVPLAFYFKTSLPVIFFLLQAGMDFICLFEKRPLWPFWPGAVAWGLIPSGTLVELVVSSGLLMVILYIERAKLKRGWRLASRKFSRPTCSVKKTK